MNRCRRQLKISSFRLLYFKPYLCGWTFEINWFAKLMGSDQLSERSNRQLPLSKTRKRKLDDQRDPERHPKKTTEKSYLSFTKKDLRVMGWTVASFTMHFQISCVGGSLASWSFGDLLRKGWLQKKRNVNLIQTNSSRRDAYNSVAAIKTRLQGSGKLSFNVLGIWKPLHGIPKNCMALFKSFGLPGLIWPKKSRSKELSRDPSDGSVGPTGRRQNSRRFFPSLLRRGSNSHGWCPKVILESSGHTISKSKLCLGSKRCSHRNESFKCSWTGRKFCTSQLRPRWWKSLAFLFSRSGQNIHPIWTLKNMYGGGPKASFAKSTKLVSRLRSFRKMSSKLSTSILDLQSLLHRWREKSKLYWRRTLERWSMIDFSGLHWSSLTSLSENTCSAFCCLRKLIDGSLFCVATIFL